MPEPDRVLHPPPGSPPQFYPGLITFLDPSELERLTAENASLKAAADNAAYMAARWTVLRDLLFRQVLGNEPPAWLVEMVDSLRAAVLQDDRAFVIEKGIAWTGRRRWFHHAAPAYGDRVLLEVAEDLLRRMRSAAVIRVEPLAPDPVFEAHEQALLAELAKASSP